MNYRPIVFGIALSAFSLSLPFATGATPAEVGSTEEGVESDRVQAVVDAMLADVSKETKYECTCDDEACSPGSCPLSSSPRAKLAGMLSYGPQFYAAFQPIAVDVVRSKSTTDAQGQALIGLLLESRNISVVPVAEAMFTAAPDRFCCSSLLGFCEMGSEALVRPLTKRVKKGDAGVPAAAFVALQGDKSAVKVLKRARSSKSIDASNALDVLVAAHALEALGSSGSLLDARIRVHDAAIAALDTDDLETARALALAAAHAESASRTSRPNYSLIALRYARELESDELREGLASADDIFELVQKVTPIG